MSPSLVEQPPYTHVFYAVFLGWVLLNARLYIRDRGTDVRRERRNSKRVLLAANSGGFLAALLAYELAAWAAVPAVPAFWCGLALLVAGGALREYAIRTLGRYFTIDLAAGGEQPVVDQGPYAWVRHPGYLGSSLSFLGIGVALANWASVVAIAFGLGTGYWYRIRVEEALLRAELGEAYEAYAERTPYRLVPGIW